MEDSEELFLQMATPTSEDIEAARAEAVPFLRAFLEAQQVEKEAIVGQTP
jgi:hypothetical protein